MAMYASFTVRDGNRVLSCPDRKFFLLGKRITDPFLSDMTVPAIGTRTSVRVIPARSTRA